MGSDRMFLGPLLIVRHGETEWSKLGRHTGRTDLDLTELGRAQAIAAAPVITELLDGGRIAHVFTSPRRRAVHTAELALREPAVVDERLAEFDYGDYEGLFTDEILDRDPSWNLWRDGCPGGEGPGDVAARCDAFLADIDALALDDEHDAVVAVCHGHLSRALVSRAVGWPVDVAAGLDNGTASVALVAGHKGRRVLRAWNRQGVVATT
jgi:broad specificity phosphatase PhoE